MSLPRLLLLTDRSQLPPGRGLVEQVAYAIDGGVRAVVLRERDLAHDERARLARDIAALLEPVDGALIAAAPALDGASGVHLRSTDPLPAAPTAPLGRSCHTADDLVRARAEAVDYAVIGPVAPTASKPGYGPALGRTGLQRMLSGHTGPFVYALGGVTADNATKWIDAGAYGVAVMGAVMRAADPAEVVADLLAAVTHSISKAAGPA